MPMASAADKVAAILDASGYGVGFGENSLGCYFGGLRWTYSIPGTYRYWLVERGGGAPTALAVDPGDQCPRHRT